MKELDFEKFKADVHRMLLSKIDLEKLSSVNNGRARQAVGNIVQEIVGNEKVPLNAAEKERIQSDLLDEVFGLGPLEPLLKDPTISDILVNNKDLVYIERGGILQKTDVVFRDDRHMLQIIDRIVSRVGRRSRRILADGGRAASGRLARKRDYSAAGAGRAGAVDPAFWNGPAFGRLADRPEDHLPARCCRFWRRRFARASAF